MPVKTFIAVDIDIGITIGADLNDLHPSLQRTRLKYAIHRLSTFTLQVGLLFGQGHQLSSFAQAKSIIKMIARPMWQQQVKSL
jgi:hypothetical protein